MYMYSLYFCNNQTSYNTAGISYTLQTPLYITADCCCTLPHPSLIPPHHTKYSQICHIKDEELTLHSHKTLYFFLMSDNILKWINAQIKQENMSLKETILNMASAQHYFPNSCLEPMTKYLPYIGTHNGIIDSI